jgi:broad specificity phosphatase PhoE
MFDSSRPSNRDNMDGFRRLFGLNSPGDNLRIIITRHGERADLALGKEWVSKMQRGGAPDSRISYLTPRSNFREWYYDSPITTEGERQSASVGRKLLQLGYPIDYCYSSPAYRSIQTATKILESQGRKAVPISVEPGRKKVFFIHF